MASTTQTRDERATSPAPFAFAEMAIRGATQMFALQMSTLRALSETQARAASAWGLPAVGAWFLNGSEEGVGRATLDTADQVISTFRRTAESVTELQDHVRELLTAQSGAANQQWQKLIERMGVQMAQSLEGVRALVEEQSKRVVQETEARVEAIAVAMQQDDAGEGGEAAASDESASRASRAPVHHANGAKSRAAQREH
ncbi:MAG TPA: hypothetical protein VMU47_01700 [Caldimonas sp.]|nr:hypothetical protein [Caldimonas sp.]